MSTYAAWVLTAQPYDVHRRRSVFHERQGIEEAEGAQDQGSNLQPGHESGWRLLGLVWQTLVPPHWAHLNLVRAIYP